MSEPINHADIAQCKNDVERQILTVENKFLLEVTKVNGQMTTFEKDMRDFKTSLEHLVTKVEFAPYRAVTYGLVAGVLIAALGAVMGKILGW